MKMHQMLQVQAPLTPRLYGSRVNKPAAVGFGVCGGSAREGEAGEVLKAILSQK